MAGEQLAAGIGWSTLQKRIGVAVAPSYRLRYWLTALESIEL
jgi:hypothetical protein